MHGCKGIRKGRKVAAHLREASDTDIGVANGAFKVAGTDKQLPFAQIALTAYVPHNYPLETLEPGLNENAFYDPTNFTYPAGSYVCEVEVDPATGTVSIEKFTAVDYFRNRKTPENLERQAQCRIATGIGHARP